MLSPLPYVGPAYRTGSAQSIAVRRIQEQLTKRGFGILDADGIFGKKTDAAVRLFQSRRELLDDGVVGFRTWTELFGPAIQAARGKFLTNTVAAAISQEHVRETAPNRGPVVDDYIEAAGYDPTKGSFPWCGCFMYWSFDVSANNNGFKNPLPRTGSVSRMWDSSDSSSHTSDPQPGSVFIVDYGSGKGHCGLVLSVDPDRIWITTIEGNTNVAGSREGDGVYIKVRKRSYVNVGYIWYPDWSTSNA